MNWWLDTLYIDKTDPFNTANTNYWNLENVILFYFSGIDDDFITQVERGLFITINYARTFTKYYHDYEVSSENKWLRSFLETWPSYLDDNSKYTLPGFSFSVILTDFARHLAYQESVCMNQHEGGLSYEEIL